jgi:hypothetical protein
VARGTWHIDILIWGLTLLPVLAAKDANCTSRVEQVEGRVGARG